MRLIEEEALLICFILNFDGPNLLVCLIWSSGKMKTYSTACPLHLKEQINRFQKVQLSDIAASVAGYSGMEELLCYASSLSDPLLSQCFYNIQKLTAAGIQNCA